MSWYDGVPATLLYAGPPQDYPAAAAASTGVQSLVTGASGGFSQASVPVGFWQQGKTGQLVLGHLAGKVTGQASATTATVAVGLVSTAGSIASGTTLFTAPAWTVTSLTNVAWELDFKLVARTVGYGTTTVSTTLSISAVASFTTTQALVAPATVTTIDASVTQWLYATVTFSTASATNSMTLQQSILYGMS